MKRLLTEKGLSLFDIYPSELRTYVHTKTYAPNVYSSFIDNCQNSKATEMSSDGLSFLYGNVCDREACHGPSPRSSGGGDAAGEEEGRLGSRDAGDTDRGEPTRRPRASATRAQGHAVGKRLRRKPLQLDARSPTRCANPPREGRPCAPVGDPLLGVPRAVAEDEVTTQGTPAPTLLSWSQSTPSLKSQHCVPDVSRPRTPKHHLPT